MKIAFLKPPIGGIIGLEMITFVEPLGLECIAGGLEPDGHECLIVDLRIEGMVRGLAKTRAFEPEMVGLQCNFTTERYRTLKAAQAVKRELPEALIVVGGHDASRDPGWWADTLVDVVVVGDGEEVMPALVDTVERRADLKQVPGLAINGLGCQHLTGPAPARRDIDELPMPARHLIKDYANEYYVNFRKPLALLETARGCPFKCNFCSVWKFHESSFREKSPARVVAEMQAIDQPNIFITDDIFWMNVRRGRELAQEIKAAGITKNLTIQTRTDIICKFPDLVEMWRDIGRITVFLGLEKIDDEGLASVNKSNTAANNDRAIDILKDLDLGWTPNFIVDPSWDRSDFAKLRAWVEERGAYNAGFSVLTPLPGTDLWDEVSDQVTTEDWELYDIAHAVLPTKLPLEEFYREYAGLWRHVLEVRYKIEGRARVYLGLLAALATGKCTIKGLRKGMNLGKNLGRPERFLRAHRESEARLAKVADLRRTASRAAAA